MGNSIVTTSNNQIETIHIRQFENNNDNINQNSLDNIDNLTMASIDENTNQQQTSSQSITEVYARRNLRRKAIIFVKTSLIEDEMDFEDEN